MSQTLPYRLQYEVKIKWVTKYLEVNTIKLKKYEAMIPGMIAEVNEIKEQGLYIYHNILNQFYTNIALNVFLLNYVLKIIYGLLRKKRVSFISAELFLLIVNLVFVIYYNQKLNYWYSECIYWKRVDEGLWIFFFFDAATLDSFGSGYFGMTFSVLLWLLVVLSLRSN